jgi:hypothetical protein
MGYQNINYYNGTLHGIPTVNLNQPPPLESPYESGGRMDSAWNNENIESKAAVDNDFNLDRLNEPSTPSTPSNTVYTEIEYIDPGIFDNAPKKKSITRPKSDDLNKDMTHAKNINPILMFLAIIIVYIAFSFWGESMKQMISDLLHNGGAIRWHQMILYAIFASIMFLLLIFSVGIPLIYFENIA